MVGWGPRQEGGCYSPWQEGPWSRAPGRRSLGGKLVSMAIGALKLGPRLEEPYFYVGESLAVSLLFEVSFPLELLLVDLSWEEAFELVAKDDYGWAESVERVRSDAVLQEGSGKPVRVEGALGSQIACDEPFGCLDY